MLWGVPRRNTKLAKFVIARLDDRTKSPNF